MSIIANGTTALATGGAMMLGSFANVSNVNVPQINAITYYCGYLNSDYATYSLDLEKQESITRYISATGILAHYYSIAVNDKFVIEKVMDYDMCSNLKKLYSLIISEFQSNVIDLTYRADEFGIRLLVNIHGSDDLERDMANFESVTEQWFGTAPIAVTKKLLIDVVD